MANLKSIVKDIETISLSTNIYKTFGEGNIWEVDGKEITYPLIWLDAETIPHSIRINSVVFNFEIYFIDLVYDDESNELNIKNDTMETALDFYNYIKDNDDLDWYVVDGQYSAQLFTEKWNDKLSGTKLSVSITTKGGSKCENIFVK